MTCIYQQSHMYQIDVCLLISPMHASAYVLFIAYDQQIWIKDVIDIANKQTQYSLVTTGSLGWEEWDTSEKQQAICDKSE